MKKFFEQIKNMVLIMITPKPIEKFFDIIRDIFWIIFAVVCLVGCLVFAYYNNMAEGYLTTVIGRWLFSFFMGTAMAGFFIFFIPILKANWKKIMLGFELGEQIKTTRVDVRHEYGSTYSATSTTETKGCLFAIIAYFIALIPWYGILLLTGPVLPICKIVLIIKNIIKYKNQA